MLKVTTSKSFSGSSMINGSQVANMYATVNEVGSITINKTIMDQNAYAKNKEEVEKDMADFDALIYGSIKTKPQDSENTATA